MLKSKKLVSAFCLFTCFSAGAQAFYLEIPYRSNDPFLFCHDGLVNAPDQRQPPCWWPLPDYRGNYMPAPWCKTPVGSCTGYWCLPYTDAEYDSLFNYYLVVCPQTRSSGEWTDRNGKKANMTPFQH